MINFEKLNCIIKQFFKNVIFFFFENLKMQHHATTLQETFYFAQNHQTQTIYIIKQLIITNRGASFSKIWAQSSKAVDFLLLVSARGRGGTSCSMPHTSIKCCKKLTMYMYMQWQSSEILYLHVNKTFDDTIFVNSYCLFFKYYIQY